MRHFWKVPLAVLSLTAFVGLTGCAPGYYDDGYYGGYAGYGDYGPSDGVAYDYASGGYCDAWGCPADYYDMPVYYGSVYYGGSWFNGPHYYRDYGGSRQYWVHGGWHNDGWSGARPNWYRPGRTGPALGRDFYRSEGFRNSRNAGQRDNRGGRPDFNRNDNNRNGNRDFGNRGNRGGGNRNAAPQSQAAPQAQPQNGGAAFRNGRFLPRSEAGNRGGGPRNSGGGGGNRGGGGGNRGGGGNHDGGDGHRGR